MNTGTKIAEVRVGKRAVYIAVSLVTIPATLLLLAIADALSPGGPVFDLPELLVALALFVPLGAVHELLHASAALVFGRLRPRDLRLAVQWKAGALMCHIKVPVRVGTARVVGLAPLVTTGPAMLGLLLWYPSEVTALLAGFAILGCAMDVAMVYRLRRYADDLLVVDHPSEPGFDIYAPEGLT